MKFESINDHQSCSIFKLYGQNKISLRFIVCAFGFINCFLILTVIRKLTNSNNRISENVNLKTKLTFGLPPTNLQTNKTHFDRAKSFLDTSYSSLPLNHLENYHLTSGNEKILKRAPQSFHFLIKEGNFCKKLASSDGIRNVSIHPNPQLNFWSKKSDDRPGLRGLVAVAVVSSAVRNFRERQNVRATWADPRVVRLTGIASVFVVGGTTSARAQRALVRESLAFRDIVQADFLDTYNNLSLKSLAGIWWGAQHCAQAPWILKTDDDVSVNVFALSEYLLHYAGSTEPEAALHMPTFTDNPDLRESTKRCTGAHCVVLCDKISLRARAVDNNSYQFGVSAAEWRLPTYPPYCHGVGYLVPTTAVPALMEAAATSTYIRVEDVFVTGILARAAGLRIAHMHPPVPWQYALHAHDRALLFIAGIRLTLELDRDLEGGRLTGSQVWRMLLERHNVTLDQS